MNQIDLKQISTLLHTVFCGRKHEMKMERLSETSLCTFYLENSIDRCWELKEHKDWLEQAEFFIQICHPISPIEILQDLTEIFKITTKIKNVNPRLLDYIKVILK